MNTHPNREPLRIVCLALTMALSLLAFHKPAQAAIDDRMFIDDFIDIPDEVNDIVGILLPEYAQVSEAFLNESFDPNIHLVDDATVSVTFVHEGAGYKNALGYFTYEDDGTGIQIIDSQLIFPNASYADHSLGWGGGNLYPGDTVTLRDAAGTIRTFLAGTRIGFFLVANGWNSGGSVAGWDPGAPTLPSTSPAVNGNVSNGVFSTIDQINPELATGYIDRLRHYASVHIDGIEGFLDGQGFNLVGVEDLRRDGSGDNDFNDLVFLVRSTPTEAISSTSAIVYDPISPDPDGDGVEGLQDAYPNDSARAFNNRTPPNGLRTLAFEDSYPGTGDKDYNDAVVQYAFEVVSDADNRVTDIGGTFHLIARGAHNDHSFGINIPGVPAGVTGTVRLEYFSSDNTPIPVETIELSSLLHDSVDSGTRDLRITVWSSTRAGLPSSGGTYSNTEPDGPQVNPASARFVINFDSAIDWSSRVPPPYDPFIVVDKSGGVDIHGIGGLPFAGRPADLPSEQGPLSFMDDSGFPWLLAVPYDWRYPIEKVEVADAYPQFSDWRNSQGWTNQAWYDAPFLGSPGRVWVSLSESLRARDWSLQAGIEP